MSHEWSRVSASLKLSDLVTEALARAGLESSNLILGIDFTKSNEWTGSRSFHRKSLHHIGDDLNPYEMVISIIGKTLAAFDEDNLIPCYGFGDASNMSEEDFADAALFALTIATVKRACMMCTLKPFNGVCSRLEDMMC
ncbi:putative copine [Helianthus annuus]|nr:putative copine [Helianthus annuus]